jgi:uncharacterized delta-60 repeat protein
MKAHLLTVLCATLACTASAQQPFELDASFRTQIGQVYVSSILPLSDGKVLASGLMRFPGELEDYTLVRLLANGTRDGSFNNSGLGQGKLTPWQDGKSYVGTSQTVRRILPAGQQDPSFIEMNLGPYFSSLQGGDYHVFPDGRVLMSGVHLLNDPVRDFVGAYCLCWFSSEGYLDTTRTHRTCSGSLDHFQALPDGKFIGSGSTSMYDGQPASNIFRFNADGSLDTAFQANATWGRAHGFLPMPDGRVYAAGVFRRSGEPDTLRFVRFLPDGSLDPSFNNHLHFGAGELTAAYGGTPSFILQVGANRLIVAGGFRSVDGASRKGICAVDTTGVLLDDLFVDCGGGAYMYQNTTLGTVRGITESPDVGFFVWGSFHGYDDGTTNDTTQRMVSRLYGLDVGVREQSEPQAKLSVHPNPAHAWVAFDYDLNVPAENAELIVLDALGRRTWRASLSLSRHQVLWDVRATAPGAYSAVLENAGARVATERLVLQH